MNGKQKIFLIILGMLMIVVAVRYGLDKLAPVDIDVETTTEVSEQVEEQKPQEVEKEYINIFFIGQNANHEEVYRAVKREYNKDIDGSKLKYAINSLIGGPRSNEKMKGVYTFRYNCYIR